MKKVALLLIAGLLSFQLFAQDGEEPVEEQVEAQTEVQEVQPKSDYRTILGDKKLEHGAYQSFSFGYSTIDAQDAIEANVRLAWIIHHWYAMGITADVFINDTKPMNGTTDQSMAGGYAGFFMEPILFPKQMVHVSFPVIVGFGMATQLTTNSTIEYTEANDYTTYLVAKPGMEVEVNLTKHIRVAGYGFYRYGLSDISLPNTSNAALNGWGGGVTVKFGVF